MTDGVLGERAAQHEVVQILAVAMEAHRAVVHGVTEVRIAQTGTQIGVGMSTLAAVAALGNVERHHAVAFFCYARLA
jgi:hypothetical protein